MIASKYEREKWSWIKPEETTLARMKNLSIGALTLMQVSTLRGIVETEQQLDAAKDTVSKLSDHQDMLEMTEQVISKVLAWKKHEAEIAYYLRTGRFPDGN